MGADMIYNEYGFLIEPTSMEHAATQPRVEVIRTLLSHGARSNPGLTQQVSEAELSGILPMLKWAEDPELGPLYFKIKKLTEAGTPEPILPIISSLGPKAFEAILDECRIDPNTGEMEWSSLVDGNMNLLLNLIQKCPEEAEVDPSIRVANIKKLHIWIQNDLTSLGEFTELEELEVSQASTLAGLSRLHGLKILKCTNPEFYRLFEKPESLSNLHSLEEIDLSANAQLNDLSGLGSLPNLKRLNLSRCNKLTDLCELTHLRRLEELDLSYIGNLEDATPLANLKNLKSLNLSHTSAAAGLDKVQALGIPDLKLPASIAPPAPTEAIHEEDQDEVFEKLVRITSEQLGISPDKITLGSRFIEDFGADSLDTVELTMAVEEEFGKEIPDAEVESIQTFGQALAYLRENQNS